jgi:hypothetical protein
VCRVAGGARFDAALGEAWLPRQDCLECVVLGTSILIPTRDLDRVTEYPLTAAPPLCEPWVGGLGLVDGTIWVSLALAGEPRGPLPGCKGVLLFAPDRSHRYAVQVEAVGTITSVELGLGILGPIPWPCPVSWFTATVHQGSDVLRLDTDAVAATLFAAAATMPARGAA